MKRKSMKCAGSREIFFRLLSSLAGVARVLKRQNMIIILRLSTKDNDRMIIILRLSMKDDDRMIIILRSSTKDDEIILRSSTKDDNRKHLIVY